MSENRNNYCSSGQDRRGMVCIDTSRVLDSCRDRDCFENARVYLTECGEQIFTSSANVRAVGSRVLYAYVGVDEVPFNCGFFRVSVRYYIVTDFEACPGLGRTQQFSGLSVLEKDVILFGGDGVVTTFTSDPDASFCSPANADNRGSTAPRATVEVLEPVILGTKTVDCSCPCPVCECIELPECVCGCLGDRIRTNTDAVRLYISLGIFSVIRITRPTQILVNATDFSVPDKECVPASNDDNPCALFRTMEFPTERFKADAASDNLNGRTNGGGRGCGCQGKN